jgi:hypothetical protein
VPRRMQLRAVNPSVRYIVIRRGAGRPTVAETITTAAELTPRQCSHGGVATSMFLAAASPDIGVHIPTWRVLYWITHQSRGLRFLP